MASYNDSGYGTITLTATIPQFGRVTAAGALAGATDQDIGVVMESGVSGSVVPVCYFSKQGTHKAIAASALTLGAKVYGAASGKVNDTQATGSFLRGVAMQAAGADGDIIEIQPCIGDTAGS